MTVPLITAALLALALALALTLICAGVRLYCKQKRPACPPVIRSVSIEKKS